MSAAYWQYALWHCLQYRKYVCLHALYNPIIQTSTVQGHPRSKIMASICSTRVVSCSSFIGTVIVSVITFAIFDVQFWWPWSMPVQGHPWSKYIGPVESPLMVSYLTSFEFYRCMCLHLRNLMQTAQKSCDLDLGRSKVIQVQRSCC